MDQSSKIAIGIALVVVLFVFTTLLPSGLRSFFGFGGEAGGQTASLTNEVTTSESNPRFTMQDIIVGTGAEAVAGKTITVHYTGTLTNGQKFDSSLDRGQPFSFTLGSGMVIKGWDMGVAGMKVGGKRKLVIPPELAYGDRAVGNVIPANSTLVFEVELLGVQDK